MTTPITETAEQTAAWDKAFAEHQAPLTALGEAVAAELDQVPADADDEAW